MKWLGWLVCQFLKHDFFIAQQIDAQGVDVGMAEVSLLRSGFVQASRSQRRLYHAEFGGEHCQSRN